VVTSFRNTRIVFAVIPENHCTVVAIKKTRALDHTFFEGIESEVIGTVSFGHRQVESSKVI